MSAAFAAMLAMCAAAACVFGAMLLSILKFPHPERAGRMPRNLTEFVWALVPIAIVIAAAAPALQERSRLDAQASARLFANRSAQEPLARRPTANPTVNVELEVRAAHR